MCVDTVGLRPDVGQCNRVLVVLFHLFQLLGVLSSQSVDCFFKHDDGFTFQETYKQSKRPHSVQNISSQESQDSQRDLEDPSTWPLHCAWIILFIKIMHRFAVLFLCDPPVSRKTLFHSSSATAAAAAITLTSSTRHVCHFQAARFKRSSSAPC